MSKFEQHIRDYYRERLGVKFLTFDYGFVGYSIGGRDIQINEWYIEPSKRTLRRAIESANAIIAIGKENGCTRLIGCNDTTLPTYKQIKTLHTYYGLVLVGRNGTTEIWARMI